MLRKTVLIAGATGLAGYAALKHFAAQPDTDVIALSRHVPPNLHGARHIPLDLTDERECRDALLPPWSSLDLEGASPVTVGSAKVITIDPATGVPTAGMDPRREAYATAM